MKKEKNTELREFIEKMMENNGYSYDEVIAEIDNELKLNEETFKTVKNILEGRIAEEAKNKLQNQLQEKEQENNYLKDLKEVTYEMRNEHEADQSKDLEA